MYITNNNRLSDKVISQTPYNVCAENGNCASGTCSTCGNDPNLCNCKKNQSPVNVIFNLNSHNNEDNSQQSPVIRPSVITPQVINPTMVRPDRVTPVIATNYDISSTQTIPKYNSIEYQRQDKQRKINKLVVMNEQAPKTKCVEEFYPEFV
jgi:hypothetical protein